MFLSMKNLHLKWPSMSVDWREWEKVKSYSREFEPCLEWNIRLERMSSTRNPHGCLQRWGPIQRWHAGLFWTSIEWSSRACGCCAHFSLLIAQGKQESKGQGQSYHSITVQSDGSKNLRNSTRRTRLAKRGLIQNFHWLFCVELLSWGLLNHFWVERMTVLLGFEFCLECEYAKRRLCSSSQMDAWEARSGWTSFHLWLVGQETWPIESTILFFEKMAVLCLFVVLGMHSSAPTCSLCKNNTSGQEGCSTLQFHDEPVEEVLQGKSNHFWSKFCASKCATPSA